MSLVPPQLSSVEEASEGVRFGEQMICRSAR
jgi:hypothetical protein